MPVGSQNKAHQAGTSSASDNLGRSVAVARWVRLFYPPSSSQPAPGEAVVQMAQVATGVRDYGANVWTNSTVPVVRQIAIP